MSKIEITNPRIVRFYKENPSINFEAVNLIFIDLFDQLLTDVNSTMNASINSQILSNLNENTMKITELNTSINYLKDAVNTSNKEIVNNLMNKFTDTKREYVDDLKNIIQNNTVERIGPLLEKHNSILIDKTNMIINDVVPKTQHSYYSQIQESIRSFHKSISDDTRILLKYLDNNSIKDYINNFEMKSSMMLQNLQQPIYTYISASEERINSNISTLKETSGHNFQNKLLGELSDFLNKTKSISQQNENKNTLNVLLNKMYNTSEVVPIIKPGMSLFSPNKNDSAYVLKRHNKSKILIQNMDIERNVNIDEIKDFVQNLEEQNCHGIFLSQHSGFSSKPNFNIEMHNKLIIVYVHNVEYSQDKIKSAVDIIDHLHSKLREINCDNDFEIAIDKEILEEINKEYQAFINQKDNLMNALKDSQKKIISQIEDFKLPALDKYLSTKFAASIQKQGFKCELCKAFNANNLKALAAHKRGCTRKNVVVTSNQASLLTTGYSANTVHSDA